MVDGWHGGPFDLCRLPDSYQVGRNHIILRADLFSMPSILGYYSLAFNVFIETLVPHFLFFAYFCSYLQFYILTIHHCALTAVSTALHHDCRAAPLPLYTVISVFLPLWPPHHPPYLYPLCLPTHLHASPSFFLSPPSLFYYFNAEALGSRIYKLHLPQALSCHEHLWTFRGSQVLCTVF